VFLHITRVEHLGSHALRLAFSDGSVREVDLLSELFGEVFEPLHDPEAFAHVYLNPDTGTIEWPDGADFAPEFLHRMGHEVRGAA
jgi:hypothetical protein